MGLTGHKDGSPKPDPRILLVLGGSQGAQEINELVWNNISELCKKYIVVHQTGAGNVDGYAADERYKPYPYIRDEMPHVLAASELVLGRSGAGTVWECAALGKPMVLVPLSYSSRGDQVENARFFEKAGAAICLTGVDANGKNLVRIINELADDHLKRTAMAGASQKIGQRDAISVIISAIGEFPGNG